MLIGQRKEIRKLTFRALALCRSESRDVCLLPNPRWSNVPRRTVKETLVRQNLYIDACSLDKSWSEERLRREIPLHADAKLNPQKVHSRIIILPHALAASQCEITRY